MKVSVGQKIRGFLFKNAVAILLCGLLCFILIRMPSFFRPQNLVSLASEGCSFGIMTIGMTMLMLNGYIDISMGAQLYLAGVITIKIYQMTGNIWVCLICSMAATVCVSLCNGVLIAKIGIPSMIATLAVKNVCKGISSLMIGKESVISMPPEFTMLGRYKLWGVPISVISLGVLFLIFIVIMKKTRFGHYVYAIGDNADACQASGINVFLTREIIFAISGALIGYAGVINVSRLGGAQFNLGEGMEFSCVAAAVVGGVSMTGGRGNMLGAVMGVIIIAALDQLLRLFSVSNYLYDVFWGAIVLFTVSADILKNYEIKRERDNKKTC